MLLLALLVQVSFLHAIATSWVPPGPGAVALQASIDAAIVAGSSEIVIQPGVYSFNSAAMNITDARNLRVRVAGNGRSADIRFELGASLVIRNASRLSVIGPLSIDYLQPPYSQATITRVGATCFSTATPPLMCEIDVKIHAGFAPPDVSVRQDLCLYPACETKLVFFNARTGFMRRPQIDTWLYNATRLPA